LLYVAELFDIIAECGFTAHAYADDTQVYISMPATDYNKATDRLTSCIIKIHNWMAINRPMLNEEKTQIIWLGTRQQLDKITVQSLTLPNAVVPFSSVVNELGVLLDSQLTMADHVAALSRSCFFYMRQLRSIKLALTPDATRTLIHAFISSLLDYCNSTLAGVSGQLLQKPPVLLRGREDASV